MKVSPNVIDREAATLFAAAPGMNVWRGVNAVTVGPHRVIDVDGEGVRTAEGWSWFPVVAIDTEDPATVGCMLAQVEQAANHTLSEVADNGKDHRRPERRHAVMVWSDRAGCERHESAHGHTRGAALVAAMQNLKKDRT
jgi:hypothetical protein